MSLRNSFCDRCGQEVHDWGDDMPCGPVTPEGIERMKMFTESLKRIMVKTKDEEIAKLFAGETP